MIYEEGNLQQSHRVEMFTHQLAVYSSGALPPTGDGLSDDIDAALGKVYEAATTGGDLKAAQDNAWVVFYNTFPSGS